MDAGGKPSVEDFQCVVIIDYENKKKKCYSENHCYRRNYRSVLFVHSEKAKSDALRATLLSQRYLLRVTCETNLLIYVQIQICRSISIRRHELHNCIAAA